MLLSLLSTILLLILDTRALVLVRIVVLVMG